MKLRDKGFYPIKNQENTIFCEKYLVISKEMFIFAKSHKMKELLKRLWITYFKVNREKGLIYTGIASGAATNDIKTDIKEIMRRKRQQSS